MCNNRRLAEKIVESGPCNLFFLFKFLQPSEQRVVMQRASVKNFLSMSSHFVIDDASQSVSLADTADTRAYIERYCVLCSMHMCILTSFVFLKINVDEF